MQIENEFSVGAPPERVYAFLLDVNRVVACVPGAELSEVVDPTTFRGHVRIRVGPITVAYKGRARIAARDDAGRTVTLEADGRETTGPGSTKATVRMSVVELDGASIVRIATDFTVVGRVAGFGRGVMEEVSKSLVNHMATCIKSNLETAELDSRPPDATPAGTASGPAGIARPPGGMPVVISRAAPANAPSLLFGVIVERIRRLFGRTP